LELILKYVRPDSLLISAGMEPVRLYERQEMEVTVVSSPIHVGSVLPVTATHELVMKHPEPAAYVGAVVGEIVGDRVGKAVGSAVGGIVGVSVGDIVGDPVKASETFLM
jgi:outer membrane lipoprotein SlyB